MSLGAKITFICLLLTLGVCIWLTGFKEYSKRHIVAFFLSWLIPGSGYLLFDKKWKFLFLLISLSCMYTFGLYISNFAIVGIDDNIYYYICQFGLFPTTVIGEVLKYKRPFTGESMSLTFLDPAQLYVCLPPLLGYLVAISVFNLKKDHKSEKSS